MNEITIEVVIEEIEEWRGNRRLENVLDSPKLENFNGRPSLGFFSAQPPPTPRSFCPYVALYISYIVNMKYCALQAREGHSAKLPVGLRLRAVSGSFASNIESYAQAMNI